MRIGRLVVQAEVERHGSWAWNNIQSTYRHGNYQLPDDLAAFRDLLVTTLRERGRQVEDKPAVAIYGRRLEEGVSRIDYRQIRFFDGLVHEAPRYVDDPALGDAARTVVRRYERLKPLSPDALLPNFAQVACALLTSDDQLLAIQRSRLMTIASGACHAGVVGGIDPLEDRAKMVALPVAAMLREGQEELGVSFCLRAGDDMKFGYFARDLERLGQPMLAGVVFTHLSMSEVLEATKTAEDGWEAEQYIPLPFTPSAVADLLLTSTMPAVGQLAFLSALESRFSREEILRAFQ